MSTGPGEQPEQEPEWPLWMRRTVEWDPTEGPRNYCACVWLWLRQEQRGLDGTLLEQLGTCVDCGAAWEWFA